MDMMNNDKLISDFLAKEKDEIDALKRKRNEKLLDSLGLFSMEKEYAPDDYKPSNNYFNDKYPKSEIIDGCKRYYRDNKKVYPIISDDTYNELVTTLREKDELTPKLPGIEKKEEIKPLEFSIISTYDGNNGFASGFMKVIAWILWIGGLILAIITSRAEVPSSYSSYRTETIFNWTTFFTIFSTYALLGGFAWCMSELFDNISSIKNQLLGYQVKEKK